MKKRRKKRDPRFPTCGNASPTVSKRDRIPFAIFNNFNTAMKDIHCCSRLKSFQMAHSIEQSLINLSRDQIYNLHHFLKNLISRYVQHIIFQNESKFQLDTSRRLVNKPTVVVFAYSLLGCYYANSRLIARQESSRTVKRGAAE